jgi:Ca2+/Na+ antiporter
MTTNDSEDDQTEAAESGWLSAGIIVAIIATVALLVTSPWILNLPVFYLLSQVVVISIVIWQACDPFADAAQWVGDTFRLPGSVRGATLDAVASSMPELFSGILFVVIAVMYSGETDIAISSGEGFGATLATCAGSAVYNMILIPAICALVVSFNRKSRPTIDVDAEVISRDGVWFIACQFVLILCLFQPSMPWWIGILFLALYALYVFQLYRDAIKYQRAMDAISIELGEVNEDTTSAQVVKALAKEGIAANPVLVETILHSSDSEEEHKHSASVLFGWFDIALNRTTATYVLLSSTLIAAFACYWLVEVTRAAAVELNVPIFFVAVILTAAASSIPDTFLSVGAAMRGDDSGAVSNAFGSNIFDICVCLSIPLLVSSYLVDWQPVPLIQDGKPMQGLVDLRILLALLTIVTLLIMWHNRQLTRNKAFVLCGLYGVFIAYAIAGSMGFSLLEMIGVL